MYGGELTEELTSSLRLSLRTRDLLGQARSQVIIGSMTNNLPWPSVTLLSPVLMSRTQQLKGNQLTWWHQGRTDTPSKHDTPRLNTRCYNAGRSSTLVEWIKEFLIHVVYSITDNTAQSIHLNSLKHCMCTTMANIRQGPGFEPSTRASNHIGPNEPREAQKN